MPPFIHKKLTRNLNVGRKYFICPSIESLFEVGDDGRQYVMDLSARTYDCCVW